MIIVAPLFSQSQSEYRLSTHILDISAGKPAPGVTVSIFKYDDRAARWDYIDKGVTDNAGRIADFLPVETSGYGIYKLRFETEEYFKLLGQKSIYPYIEVIFYINEQGHYHIPITLSANGYSTYRGS